MDCRPDPDKEGLSTLVSQIRGRCEALPGCRVGAFSGASDLPEDAHRTATASVHEESARRRSIAERVSNGPQDRSRANRLCLPVSGTIPDQTKFAQRRLEIPQVSGARQLQESKPTLVAQRTPGVRGDGGKAQ